VTGCEEMIDVLRDADTFSSCNAVTGPFPGLPVRPAGDDVTALIDQHRHVMPMSDYLITKDSSPRGAALTAEAVAHAETDARERRGDLAIGGRADR